MSRKRRLLFGRLTAAFFLFSFSIIAIGQGAWELGRYRLYAGSPSPPLQFNFADSGGLGSYDFVSKVGGIAFVGVAVPSAALEGQKVRLQYNGSADDGGRLEVTVGESKLRTALPDWMLVPIARYSGSKFDSCVSLFGPKTTDDTYDIVYHEEFQNTLLGLRLLQADMLLFDIEETWQLPRFNGKVILGLGETAPGRGDELIGRRIAAAMENADFQSWVMTDQGEEIVFDADNGQLRVTGLPFYYFWTSDVESVQKRQEELYQRALAARAAGRVAEHNRLVDQINKMTPEVRDRKSVV